MSKKASSEYWGLTGARRLAAAWGLLMSAALMLPGCVRQKTLTIGIEGGVVGLDPHLQDEAVTVSVLGNIYEGLVAFDHKLKLVPVLAEGYSNPDDLTWRFHLRKGVRFHHGRLLTAEDVVYSLRRAWQDSSSIYRGMLSGIERVEALDQSTVEVITKEPLPTMANILTLIAVVPQGSDSAPPGTGPYRLEARLAGGSVRLKRFENYWGRLPEFSVVEYRNIEDEQRRAEALMKGEIDVDAAVAESQRKRLEVDRRLQTIVCPSSIVGVLGFNLSGRSGQNPVADPRVRRAISLAIDRKALVEEVYHGYAQPSFQLVPPTVVGYDPELSAPAREVALARRLLRQAGFKDSLQLTLEISQAAWPVARALIPQLAEAGIAIRPDTIPWEVLYRDIYSGKSRFYFMGFAFSFGDASEMLNELHTQAPQGLGANNLTGYSNPALDRVLVAADREFDPARRWDLLKQAGRIALEDLPYVPLYVREYCYGLRRGLEWTPRSDGLVLAAEFRRKK